MEIEKKSIKSQVYRNLEAILKYSIRITVDGVRPEPKIADLS